MRATNTVRASTRCAAIAGRLAAALLLTTAAARAAEPVQLVTPEEMRASAAAGAAAGASAPLTRALPSPDAPKIIVERPTPGVAVDSPTPIRLRFQAHRGATVRPETLRVRYGALRLDVTERILALYRPRVDGLDVAEAALPAGQHRFLLSITDTAGRTGEQRIDVEVRPR
jgi:hypothetical protein